MLGPTANGRLMGPGTIGSSGSAHHRNLWPSAAAAAIAASSTTSSSSRSFEFQTSNGEVTESLFAAGGYNTPPASSPFLSCSPLELVAKNFHSTGAAVTFSQANSSIFVQSQTDFINGTTAVAKKTETCIGRWEHGTLEPLQIQIKREPCQVSEVTTSNNFEAGSSNSTAATTTALTAVVKLEAPSPKAAPVPCSANLGTAMDHLGITSSTQNNAAATIPVGIAVARQRLQESATGGVGGPAGSQLSHHQAKELNRFGIAATGSTADLGCATPSLSQNMFFAGTNSTMIPLSSEAVTMGVTNAAAAAAAAAVQNAVRTPPALWQYPAPLPMESMLPMPPMPPVGFQLVRDPSTGQILFLPTTTTIDPFPQTVVWPSYPQSTAAIQPPHLLLPQIPQQQLQPPPLAPLQMLSSDYLATASSTTLHQQQHTQTHHSTRYVALTSDGNKRANSNKSTASSMSMPCQPAIPMPIPSHTFIKIEDCSGSSASSCNNSTQIFQEQEKTIQTATIGTSPDIAPQLLFQQGNLIQITPSAKTTATLLEPPAIMPAIATATPNPITPPPSTVSASIVPSPLQPELPAATCLTPPPDQSICQTEDAEAASSSCAVPEVQDANIQTDTPIMSEDDNTVGTDDVPHQQDASTLTLPTNPSDEAHFPETFVPQPTIIPTEMLCHSIINNSGDSAIEPDMSTHSTSGTSLNLSNTSSTNCDQTEMEPEDNVITSTASAVPAPETQPLTVNANCGLRIPKLEMLSPVEPPTLPEAEEYHQEPADPGQQEHPVDLSGLELLSRSIEVFQKKASMIKKEPISPQLPPEPPQLLPLPPLIPTLPEIAPQPPIPQPTEPTHPAVPPPVPDTFIRADEPMVGLNLLCALAEQRFQEEGMFKKDSPANTSATHFSPSMSPADEKHDHQSAESSSSPPQAPLAAASPEIPSRKRKHKHSKDSRKSSKKSKHDKEQRRERKRKHSSDAAVANEDDEIDGELKQSFSRIKAKLENCGCKDADEKDHRCCAKATWPSTANELFSVIESDMKERLVNITRQCEEKKRELEQMSSTSSVAKVKPLAAMVRIPDIGKSYFGGFGSGSCGLMNGSSGSGTTSNGVQAPNLLAPKLSTIPALSPNFSSSSNSTTFVELPKLSSDTDSSKLEDVDSSSIERLSFSKRKGGIPKKHDDIALTETIVAKKPKSLVGYILASKNRVGDSNVKESGHHKSSHHHHHHHHHRQSAGIAIATSSKHQQGAEVKQKKSPIHSSKFESTTSDDTSNLSDSSTKAQVKIKSPAFSFEDENSKPSDAAFSIFGGKPSIFDKVKTSPMSTAAMNSLKLSPVQAVVTPLKHHSKHKKSRSKERKRRSSEKKRIDQKCLLTSDYLNQNKTRVLTAMGGLFYAGCLSAVQPPDIYAVTLDGERGNRPHIMSREEVLRDAILEVAPKAVDEIIPGTRLCAYWSQQYRCLYPGVAAEPTSPDPEKRYVNVEFDDGDSGRIALEDIRFLLSDYPLVEYDPNPLLSLGKRKRQPSVSEVGIPAGTTTAGMTASAPLAATATTSSTTTTITTTNCFAVVSDRTDKRTHDDAYREERRRLKKIRKDKLRRLAANNAELSSHKHKKKSKCYDEYCKHRKHKKRRKHKKHHREHDVPSSPDQAAAGSMDDDISQGDSASQTAGPFSPASVADVPIAEEKPEEKEVFYPSLKEDTMTENEEASSSITESSGSYYQPKKSSAAEKSEKRQSTENNSKIAAFLPARQLWAWCGKGYRRSTGRVKKQFYKSIQRGKETISVGDSAVFLSTGRPDRPYIGHIESMWETSTNNMVVRVKWFYHPEETEGCPNLKYPGALFQSPHEDENDVQTISHKCEVLALKDYTAKFGADPKQYSAIYDNNDTYYLAGYYDPTVITIKMQPDIEVLQPGEEKWVKTD